MIPAYLSEEIIFSNSQEAFSLFEKSRFGEKVGGKIQYSFPETIFLVEKNKMEIFSRNKKVSHKELLKKIHKFDKRINIKYLVFKDLREKGYVVKTALKFGADFRIYEKGAGVGKEHSKWIVFSEISCLSLANRGEK